MGLGAHAPILPASDVHLSHKDWALRLALFRFFVWHQLFALCKQTKCRRHLRTAFPHLIYDHPVIRTSEAITITMGKEKVSFRTEPPPEERWSEHKLITRDCQRIGKVLGELQAEISQRRIEKQLGKPSLQQKIEALRHLKKGFAL